MINKKEEVTFHHTEMIPAVERYGELVASVQSASKRMKDITNLSGPEYLQACGVDPLLLCGYPNYKVWVTDQAEKIPFPETVYHVTGLYAATNIINGKPLLPVSDHLLKEQEQVTTHKGIAAYLFPEFLKILEINTGHLEQFLFSGPKIDPEQLDHTLHLPYKTVAEYDKAVKTLFLRTDTSMGYERYGLSHGLEEIIRALDKGKKPGNNSTLKTTVDSFLGNLYKLMFMRAEWLEKVRDILYGIREIDYTNLENNMTCMLAASIDSYDTPTIPISTKPAVLEINTQKLIRDLNPGGLFTVLIAKRPVQTIFSSLIITPASVGKIFVGESDISQLSPSDIPTYPLSDIPSDAWLGGIDLSRVKPDQWNPLCGLRYDTESQTPYRWSEAAQEKIIAPFYSIHQYEKDTPDAVLVSLMGKDYFSFEEPDMEKRHPDDPYERQTRLFQGIINESYPCIDGVFS